jgi:uncharacterized protein (TIGR03437 family)
VFVTGVGQTSPASVTGMAGSGESILPLQPFDLFGLGKPLRVSGVPGEISGIVQVQVRVPDSAHAPGLEFNVVHNDRIPVEWAELPVQ